MDPTTLPLLDLQEVTPVPRVPLSSASLYFKQANEAGIIGIKLFTKKVTSLINVESIEKELKNEKLNLAK